MSLIATVAGIGFSGFLFLYAAFSISNERMLEKSLLYFGGIAQALVMVFILLSESMETGSDIAYLSIFFEKYFMVFVYFFFAVVAVFMLYILEKAINRIGGGKDGEE